MPLTATGSMLGPYQVLDKIGEGGMGEMYKARDTRLDRTVAIKVAKETWTPANADHSRPQLAVGCDPMIC